MIYPSLPVNENQRLLALAKFAMIDRRREEDFDRVTRLIATICNVPIAIMSFVDVDREWFKASVGLGIDSIARNVSFCAHAMSDPHEVFLVPDALIDPRFSRNPYVIGEPFVRFYAAAPLRTADGYVLGHLCAIDRVTRQLSPKQLWALRTAASSVVALLEHKRLLADVRGASPIVERLDDQVQILMQPAPMPAPLTADDLGPRASLDLPGAIIDAIPGIFYLLDANGKHLIWNKRLEEVSGYSRDEIAQITPLELISSNDQTYLADRIRRAFVVGSASADASLETKDGRKLPYYFTARIVEFRGQRCLAGIGIDISERKQAEELLRFAAQHDPLTGLGNRRMLSERLTQSAREAVRRNRLVAVMFLDLDQFKLTNDTLGHNAGDELLKAVAQRVRGALRAGDAVARLGGDEFVVVADVQCRDDVQALIASVQQTFLKPFSIGGHLLHLSASIGICIYPSEGTEPEHLLRNADAAMYRAKALGPNSFAYFTADMHTTALKRLTVERELRLAVSRGELELYFQPIIDLRSGDLVAAEGLLRWNHPARGVLTPSDFMNVAEEAGLIVSIGAWVLEQGAKQARRLSDLGAGHCYISVNVSARQLLDAAFVESIRAALRDSNASPESFAIEVTESTALEDPSVASGVLRQCKELGLSILLDDFGTHSAAVTYLKSLPIDVIKIDRSLVEGLPHDGNDVGIVSAVIALANGSGCTVIAEGVETPEQRDWLVENKCYVASGYLLARPMPAPLFEDWIRR